MKRHYILRILLIAVVAMLVLVACERPIRENDEGGNVINEAIGTVESEADVADGSETADGVGGDVVDEAEAGTDEASSAEDGYPAAGDDAGADVVVDTDEAVDSTDTDEAVTDADEVVADDAATDANDDGAVATGDDDVAADDAENTANDSVDANSEGDVAEDDDSTADTSKESEEGGEADDGAADAAEADSAEATEESGDVATGEELIHFVQNGETLFLIGLRYGVSWIQIAEANGITNPARIAVGQELKIPTVAVEGEQPEFVHVVRYGETVFLISLRYGKAWADVAEANGLSEPFIIYPGDTITIPGG